MEGKTFISFGILIFVNANFVKSKILVVVLYDIVNCSRCYHLSLSSFCTLSSLERHGVTI